MHINITYEQEFYDLWEYWKAKFPKRLFDMSGIGKQLDFSELSREFFSTKTTAADVSMDPNANVADLSVIAYDKEISKPLFLLNSYYVLWKKIKQLYGREKAKDIIEKQLTGSIYVNDFYGVGAGKSYCMNYSTMDIATQGLPMIQSIYSVAPKFLYSFKSQLEQFLTIASNSTLGATGLADILITTSAYVKNILETKSDAHFTFSTEKDCWSYIKENLASFIYTVNQPIRGGLQSPFTNVSVFDDYFLDNMIEDYRWVIGEQEFSADKEITKKLQILYMDIINEEMSRTPVRFPVTTACFSIDEDKNIQDHEFLKLIAEKNQKYGFINIYTGKSSTLSSCCRLRSDTENEYFNSFGSGSSKIGSQGVCTINLPRLGFIHKGNEPEFFKNLEELVYDCQDINNAKRHIIKKRIENGNLPLYSLGFMSLQKQYSTVGINGFYEAIELMGYDIMEKDGQEFALKILDIINNINEKLEKKYSAPHNVEQIPAENVSVKLADKDKLMKFNSGEYDIYSNQFIPLTHKADLLDRITLQGLFDSHFSGGAICHLNVEQEIDDPKKIEDLIISAAKMGVVYFAINYVLQKCENNHMSVANGEDCPRCKGKIIEKYTRVVGFLVPVRNWHKTRREVDFPNRQFYKNGNFTLEKVA